jgi:hypothetical protein
LYYIYVYLFIYTAPWHEAYLTNWSQVTPTLRGTKNQNFHFYQKPHFLKAETWCPTCRATAITYVRVIWNSLQYRMWQDSYAFSVRSPVLLRTSLYGPYGGAVTRHMQCILLRPFLNLGLAKCYKREGQISLSSF